MAHNSQGAFPGEMQLRLRQAAQMYNVPAGLVAAVLDDERQRYNFFDTLQDMIAHWLVRFGPRGQYWLRRTWETLSRESIETQSFGPSQMNLGVLRELVQEERVQIAGDCKTGDITRLLQALLDEQIAAKLVAARLRQIIDHWQAGGVDIAQRPDILGTLYSIGLEGAQGVHPDPKPNPRGRAIASAASALEKEVS